MKKITILLCAVALAGCTSKEQIAPVQANGLNYTFLDYIGPDSCKLYKCAYLAPGSHNADEVFLTVCDGTRTTATDWDVQQGKVTEHFSNSVVFDTTQVMVPDTQIKMVPKTIITKRK